MLERRLASALAAIVVLPAALSTPRSAEVLQPAPVAAAACAPAAPGAQTASWCAPGFRAAVTRH